MVQAYRLLAAEMARLGWDYPLHLGVTEAGEGEDGRMKSAIGIGALLNDGLGDTIRVSLTEDPEREFQPCNRLAEIGTERLGEEAIATQKAVPSYEDSRDIFSFSRRAGELPGEQEGDPHPHPLPPHLTPLTPHPSRLTPHPHPSPITHHHRPSPITLTPHPSTITHHPSPITHHPSPSPITL